MVSSDPPVYLNNNDLVEFEPNTFETQSALWEIRDELNLAEENSDIKMVSLFEDDDKEEIELENNMIILSPDIKANLLYVAP